MGHYMYTYNYFYLTLYLLAVFILVFIQDLRTVSPRQLSDKYFKLFPEEVNPIWSNPCKDKRHLGIQSH